MHSKVFCAALNGIDADIVEVEVNVSSGLPNVFIVGLADTSIRESKERVRACLKSGGFTFPLGRVAINLAPANLFKYGTHFDVSIALGLLRASEQLNFDAATKLFLGELALDGSIRPIFGTVSMVLAAKQQGLEEVYVPAKNFSEASLVQGVKVLPLQNFAQLVAHLTGAAAIKEFSGATLIGESAPIADFADISGQDFAKRGLEIAAAGGHNILLTGPPGSGKTLLAQAMQSILPANNSSEFLEVVRIYSAAGYALENLNARPFRSPGKSITLPAFIGGGKNPKPGELSLAHNGVLFLDEFAEYPRAIIESLREPLEHGIVKIFRIQKNYTFPAKFILVAATNPCPCGFFGDARKRCMCSPGKVMAYKQKISGPILDRIDLQINVHRIDLLQYQNSPAEKSVQISERILSARAAQYNRCGCLNSVMRRGDLARFCKIDLASQNLLARAEEKYHFSGRTLHRLLRLARTIADLKGAGEISSADIAESLQYRLAE